MSRTSNGDIYAWRMPGHAPAPGAARPSEPRFARAEAAFDQAESLQDEGKYAGAIARGEEALQLLDGAPSSERLPLARCLGLLGGLHWLRGDFARAEPLLLRALAIYEAGLLTEQPEVASLLNRLAILYQSRGLYGRAEPLHRRALALQEAFLGKGHVEVADSLNNLAILYKAQGLYDRAEPLHRRALLIREAALGTGHPDVAFSLINLAGLYRAQGQCAKAEPLALRALAIQEAALGPDHPDVALSLIDLAGLHRAQGQWAKAEPLARRALAIQEAALGPKHPLYARSLNELAALSREQGQYAQAEALARRALAIREAALGESHPEVAESLDDVALLCVAQGRLSEALPLLSRAFSLSEERLRREALDFSESRLAGFLQYLRADEERLHALLRAHPENPGLRRLALTAALLWKGRSAQETANTSRAVYRSLEPQDREAFDRLRDLRSQLARLSLDGSGPLAGAGDQERMKELMDQGDAVEAGLARRSARLRALGALPPAGDIVDRVAAALPKDAALVELVAYADRLLAPARVRYQALVLLPDARIQSADLGPAEPIDLAAARFRDALADQDAGYQVAARELQALLFQPLRRLLGGARHVFLSPDGQTSLVPFAALPDDRGFLGDTFSFTYLTSGKDLLLRPMEGPRSSSVVVFADPDYGTAPAPGAPAASEDDGRSRLERSYALARAAPTLRLDRAGRPWAALPGTRGEAEDLQRLFPAARVFAGPEATKDQLLHVVSPGILHIATHGFFLEDEEESAGARTFAPPEPAARQELAARAPDPLLRSGLVLAGATASVGGGAQGLDRTLVTALELAGLDLWGTQLVVLSACDTGRGDIRLGQGVYGLRRALAVAGAETVVMSLWKVDDETTRTLMERYYRELLAGRGRTAALRNAMNALRRQRPHPHFWAPFISAGRDGPLEHWVGG